MYSADEMIFSKCRSIHVSFLPNSLWWLLLTIKVDSDILDTSYMVLHDWPHALCSSVSLFKFCTEITLAFLPANATGPLDKLVFVPRLFLPLSQVHLILQLSVEAHLP